MIDLVKDFVPDRSSESVSVSVMVRVKLTSLEGDRVLLRSWEKECVTVARVELREALCSIVSVAYEIVLLTVWLRD